MTGGNRTGLVDRLLVTGAAALITGFAVLFLHLESEAWILILLAGAGALAFVLGRGALGRRLAAACERSGRAVDGAAVLAVLVLIGAFYEQHFTLLMIATALLYLVTCLGLTIQFGFAGLLNFAGAAFFGIGCYTAAVLTGWGGVPALAIVPIGGVVAAVIGGLIIWPVLRTRGHYAALVTIAFGLLFETFLEVNDALGGPQGLPVGGMTLFGWDLNAGITLGEGVALSFLANYALAALGLLVIAYGLTRRLDRSWIGLNLDAIRLDEIAAKCFGIDIAYWKAVAFTAGNFLAGSAGALYGMMIGFIAPDNFTFGTSLTFVSIVLLGGLGSVWGAALATALIVFLPEKLQVIQEYRYLLFAALVIAILLFRPDGLIPRRLRIYFPGFGQGGAP